MHRTPGGPTEAGEIPEGAAPAGVEVTGADQRAGGKAKAKAKAEATPQRAPYPAGKELNGND